MKKLIGISDALQQLAGGNPFYLSCRTAQRICGVSSAMTISRRLKRLVDDGILELVESGTWLGKRASTYRYTP